jgi:methylenetetrahydrofolate dehydrogenase (NADP+) / methenyltetrahydrofolate cyclohydrolase
MLLTHSFLGVFMALLLQAAPVIDSLLPVLQEKVKSLKSRGITPTMHVLLVGEHPPSMLYTRHKQKFCHSIGAECEIIRLPENIEPQAFLARLAAATQNPAVHGCFVQLPLPAQLQELPIGDLIPPKKDVDGFHERNLLAIFKGESKQALVPCTPKGILTLLDHYGIELKGKHAVVIGRSMIVGRPMAALLIERDATVTHCHSRTQSLEKHCQSADLIISAVGKPRYFNERFLRHDQSQILIDVGINHDADGILCGDFDFKSVEPHARALTPVPGGVGKMTIFSLAQNLLQAAESSL